LAFFFFFWPLSGSHHCHNTAKFGLWSRLVHLTFFFLCGRNRLRFGPSSSVACSCCWSFFRWFVRQAVLVFRSRYSSRRRPKALICLFGFFFFFFCKVRNRERRCSASALSFSEVGESFACRRAFLEASLSAAA
jgi:hypothetical protein